MIQVFYGTGKGKTSSLNGMAVRAKGAGFSVLIVRYLKGVTTSEDTALEKLGIDVKSFHYGNKFVFQMTDEEKSKVKESVQDSLNWILDNHQKYDIILLDEIIDLAAENVKILTEEEIISLINKICFDREIVLTGHIKLNTLLSMADLITEFKSEKHYYEKGIKARKGIEY